MVGSGSDSPLDVGRTGRGRCFFVSPPTVNWELPVWLALGRRLIGRADCLCGDGTSGLVESAWLPEFGLRMAGRLAEPLCPEEVGRRLKRSGFGLRGSPFAVGRG